VSECPRGEGWGKRTLALVRIRNWLAVGFMVCAPPIYPHDKIPPLKHALSETHQISVRDNLLI